MRCKLLVWVLVLSLFTSLVLASSEIKLEPVKISISLAETASYKLSVTNLNKATQRYSLFSLVQGWEVEPSPLKDKVMELGKNQTGTTTIVIRPKEAFNPGVYSLDFNIETDSGEKYTETIKVYINPDKPFDYLPSIKTVLDISKNMNPQEPQLIKLLLENKNPLNMPKLVVRLQSDILEFNQEVTLSLAPFEKKSVEFTVVPNPLQKPGDYFLFFTFEKGGDIVKVINQGIEIQGVTPPFKVESKEEKAFLKKTKTLQVLNTGNIGNTQKVNTPVSFWGNLVTLSKGAVTVKEKDQRYLSWTVSLPPAGTATLTAVQNYRSPIYLLLIIIALVIIYFYVKSPISLTKTATSMKHDASLSELKITLHIKNLAKKSYKNLEVIDLIPGIADIEKSLDVGTLKPQEIKHTKKGTLIKWKLAEIEAREDRLITYKIKSTLKILGELRLPRAKAIFNVRGKNKTTYSNTFKISSKT